MPIFFDPNDLTPRQKSRWNDAILEYKKITDQRVSDYLSSHTQGARASDGAIRLILGISPPGDPSSALFARLLDGKPALPFAPPTRFGYPWYALFDRPEESHPVMDVSLFTPTEHDRKSKLSRIVIDGCPWEVVWANKVAAQMIGESRSRFSHMDHLNIDAVINEDKPVFIIKFHDAPEFRLSLGREVVNIQRRNISDMLKMRFKRADRLNYGDGNPIILGVTDHGLDVRRREMGVPPFMPLADGHDSSTNSDMDYINLEVDAWMIRIMNKRDHAL